MQWEAERVAPRSTPRENQQRASRHDPLKERADPAHRLRRHHILLPLKQKGKGRKTPQGVEDAASILRGIEISLRTNSLRLVSRSRVSPCAPRLPRASHPPRVFGSWVQEFVNFQPPYDEKDKSKTRRKGGLHILMDYFTLLDEDTRSGRGRHCWLA